MRRGILALAMLLAAALCGGEFRGAWIHSPTGVPGWGWDRTIRALADGGYNAVFPNMVWAGVAEYPNAVLAPHPTLRLEDGGTADRLAECLEACRKYGVQCHVWIVVCNLGHRTPEGIRQYFRDSGRTQMDDAGKPSDFLAPQLPENVELLRRAVVDRLKLYPVDGVHLDYIRYPLGKYDYSPKARKAFEAHLKRKVVRWPQDCMKDGCDRLAFLAWRRENITALVRVLRQAVKETRPGTALSAAVYGYWPGARESVAQDAALWVREGLVDFLCPMNYSADPWEAAAWLRQQLDAVDGRVPVYSGLANYMCKTVGDLERQIQETREYGADGFITFQCTELFADQWLPALAKGTTKEWERPPYPHQQPRLELAWDKAPLSWRDWRHWFWRRRVGDLVACTVQWPAAVRPGGEGAAIRLRLVRDGDYHPAADVKSVKMLPDGRMRLAFQPSKPGWYRWEIVWRDVAGKYWTWRSTTRHVR